MTVVRTTHSKNGIIFLKDAQILFNQTEVYFRVLTNGFEQHLYYALPQPLFSEKLSLPCQKLGVFFIL